MTTNYATNWNTLYGIYYGNHMVDSLTDTVFFSELLLLEPTEEVFLNASIQNAVEETLRRKAEGRHYCYTPIPVTSQRYRFVALNKMAMRLSMQAENDTQR